MKFVGVVEEDFVEEKLDDGINELIVVEIVVDVTICLSVAVSKTFFFKIISFEKNEQQNIYHCKHY